MSPCRCAPLLLVLLLLGLISCGQKNVPPPDALSVEGLFLGDDLKRATELWGKPIEFYQERVKQVKVSAVRFSSKRSAGLDDSNSIIMLKGYQLGVPDKSGVKAGQSFRDLTFQVGAPATVKHERQRDLDGVVTVQTTARYPDKGLVVDLLTTGPEFTELASVQSFYLTAPSAAPAQPSPSSAPSPSPSPVAVAVTPPAPVAAAPRPRPRPTPPPGPRPEKLKLHTCPADLERPVRLAMVGTLRPNVRPEVREAVDDMLTFATVESDEALSQRLGRDLDRMRNDWQAIDLVCNTYRRCRLLNPSGTWMLSYVYEHLEEQSAMQRKPDRYRATLERYAEAHPESVMVRLVLGKVYTGEAWSARGGATADMVDPAAWPVFESKLKEAHAYLTEAAALEPDPYVQAALVTVGMGLGLDKKTVHGYVDRAWQIDGIHCWAPSREYCLYIAPRWLGEPGDIGRFIDEMTARSRAQLGEGMYARLASQYLYERAPDFEPDWKRLQKGHEDLMKRFPRSLAVVLEYLEAAQQVGDEKTARRLLDGIGSGKYPLGVTEFEIREFKRKYSR